MARFIYFALVLMVLSGQSQTSFPLNYAAYLSNVVKYNPQAQRAENENKLAELKLKAARGNYDPIVNGSYDQKQFNGSNYYSYLNSEVKLPVFTSQYFKFGYEYGNGTYINPEDKTSPGGLPYLGVEMGVLQGLMIDKRRAEVLKSREYLNYYDAEKRIQLNVLLFDASQKYFDWLFSLKQMALNNYFMQVAKQRLIGIEALANIGEKAAVDTVEAAIFYQNRLLDLQNALIDNQKSSNEVAAYNWQNGKSSTVSDNFMALDSLDFYFTATKAVLLKRLQQQTPSNPVLVKYNSFQKVLEIENRLKREMIKPNLNVKYNLLSNSNAALNPAFSNNNYKFGINVSFPLFLRNPTNDYRVAKINSQNNQLELINKGNELNFKLNALNKTIGILAEQLQNAERTARYSELLVSAEKMKFNNGESTLFMLNTRENKWLESEIKLAEYKLKFIKTVLNIIYLNGDLNYEF